MNDRYLPLYLFTLVLSLATCAIILKNIIPRLKRLAPQPILAEGPHWHLSKHGTPTMGGISFLVTGIAAALIATASLALTGSEYEAISLLTLIGYATLNALIGIIDDLTKLRRKENAGLTPFGKLLLQALVAVLFLFARATLLSEGTTLYFSFGSFDIGPMYYILAFIMLIATVNCANLTDGVDGLASGVAFVIGICLFYISFSSRADVAIMSLIEIGISLAFLFFNLNPARIFMGDTGSLYFGAILGGCALCLGNPLIVAILGSVYLIEGLSVIIQVAVYKITGRRVFKMAPIHHHFERLGCSENKIVIGFMLLTLLTSLLCPILFV